MMLLSVIESHPDSALDDLRLDRTFPGLSSYCDALDLHTMSKKVTFYFYLNTI